MRFDSFFIRSTSLLAILFCCAFVSAADLPVPSVFPTIQSAIDAAIAGDVVTVSPGTYQENLNYNGKSITVESTGGPEVTTIDGSLLTSGLDNGSTIRFVNSETPLTKLIGFKITGGTGVTIVEFDNIGNLLGTFSVGGGVLCLDSRPTIQNCIFVGNDAQKGAGLYAGTAFSLTLLDCQFSGNSGLEGGGAFLRNIAVLNIENCTFVGNSASTAGGGLSIDECQAATVRNCTLTDNNSLIGGGLDSKNSSIQVLDSVLSGNNATLIGGGVTFYNSPADVSGCTITGNSSSHGAGIGVDGGVIAINRTLIAGNNANSQGGAIATTVNSSSITLFNVTIADNSAVLGSGGIYIPTPSTTGMTIKSSILWNNGVDEISHAGQAIATWSDVMGGFPGLQNLSVDPIFSNPAGGDYTLVESSPCVDAGDPSDPADADGTAPDLGAFFHDQRPDPASGLNCTLSDPCTGLYTFSWSTSGNVDAVLLHLNGQPVTTVDPATTSWQFSLTQGAVNQEFCVITINNGLSSLPVCCSFDVPAAPVPQPLIGFSCDVDHVNCEATLTWTNGEAYAGLEMTVAGQPAQALDPGATSVVVPLEALVATEMCVTASTVCGATLPPICCEVTCIPPPDEFRRGDANMDGVVDLADVMFSLVTTFEGVSPVCMDGQDTNDDGELDLSDPIYSLLYLYAGGTAPPAPGAADCGPDATDGDLLECIDYPGCI